MTTNRTWMMAASFVMMLGACGGSKPATETAASESTATCEHCAHHGGGGHEHGGCDHNSCPMMVEGVTVSYEETPDGAAMVFTTASGDVTDLQRRIAEKAERHNSGQPPMKPGMVPHSARADNVEKGARLVMIPTDPKDLDALRTHVKERAETLQKDGCPMKKHDHPHGEPHEHGEHHGEGEHHGGHHDHH